MRKILYMLFVQYILLRFGALSLRLNTPNILLTHNLDSSSNFTLKLLDATIDKCESYLWQAFSSDVTITPLGGICPSEAIVSVLTTSTKHLESVISVSDASSNTLFCDVIVDPIHEIELQYSTSKMYLHGPPTAISVVAKNREGSSFTSINNLEFMWSVKEIDSASYETSSNIVKFLDQTDFSYHLPNMTSSVLLLQGENVGAVVIKVSLKHPYYSSIPSAEMTLTVTTSEYIKPSGPIYVLKGATVPFHLESRYGNALDISSYSFEVQNISVARMDNNVLTAIEYGETSIFVTTHNKNTFDVNCHVVQPTDMSIDVQPLKDWKLHEGKTYKIVVKLWDAQKHEIFLSENAIVRTLFPGNLFHTNSSSPNGAQHTILALVPGSGMIRAEFLGVKTKGNLQKLNNLNASKKVVIYQAMQIFPSVLLLPFYVNSSAMYNVKFKVSGGTGFYSWTSSNPAAVVSHDNHNMNEAVVHFHDKGDFIINVVDKNSSHFRTSAMVSVQPIADIEVYPTVVEAAIGNEIILPVGILGFANKDTKIYHAFDDCSKINISVEIIEKHILLYKPGAYVPPFGRGCHNLLFQCRMPGHTRINLVYESEKILKTTVVVSCFKLLKPINPVRIGVLALGTSKEVAFEGGPRPWPLLPDGHILKLTAETLDIVNISIIKDPVRYNRDLHVFRVTCRTLGDTVLVLNIGNKASPTNPNPAILESSVRIFCSKPHTIHLAYKTTKDAKKIANPSDMPIVKVPFYGEKQFEIDVWIKDEIGRKFANISVFNMYWKSSDYTIAKPLNFRDFVEHIDGSSGYRKVSRNFQAFKMSGSTGALIATVELKGYHNSMLLNMGILNFEQFEPISNSLELKLVSMRDLYADAYNSNAEQNLDETCTEDTCKS